MTDAKQALEVVERLREGAGRVARHCMRAPQPGDPGLISIPRHERDIDAIMEQAASLLSSLAEENERLTNALHYEENLLGRIGTHGPGCETWGPAHYECAMRENARLREALKPFAVVGKLIDGPFGPALFVENDRAFSGGCAWTENGEKKTLTWGDFRAARQALTTHPAQPEGEGHE